MNELTKQEPNEVALGEDLTLEQMMAEYNKDDVTVSDIKIPKLLVMQQMSKFVAEQELCKAGDLVNSVTGEVYASGKDGKAVTVFPILGWKTWQVEEMVNGKYEYKRTEPATDAQERIWEEPVDGVMTKNTFCHSYYVMREEDIHKDGALPHVISFRSTSLSEGKNIATRAAVSKLPLFFSKFEIGAEKTTNDHGTWYKMTAKHTGDLDTTEVKAANVLYKWWKTLEKSAHSDVDNSDIANNDTPKVDTTGCEF